MKKVIFARTRALPIFVAHTLAMVLCVYRIVCMLPSGQAFDRIVGSFMVDPGKYDLGLNLVQEGRFQLLGYSR